MNDRERLHVSFKRSDSIASQKKSTLSRATSRNSSRPTSKNSSRLTSNNTSRSSSKNASRPTTASSRATSATSSRPTSATSSRPSTPGVCREHSYCYKPSNPSYYPVGLPWASGKLKCIPGYCNYDYKTKRSDEEKQRKDRSVRTLRPVDPVVKEELAFFLRMATWAGDYNDNDFYQKMEMMRLKMKYRGR